MPNNSLLHQNWQLISEAPNGDKKFELGTKVTYLHTYRDTIRHLETHRHKNTESPELNKGKKKNLSYSATLPGRMKSTLPVKAGIFVTTEPEAWTQLESTVWPLK